jgi:hypothetical protein
VKRILILPLAIIIGLGFQSQSLLAQDQGPTTGDKKNAEASPKGGGRTHHATKNVERATQHETVSHGDKAIRKTSDMVATGESRSENIAKQSAKTISGSAKTISQSARNIGRGQSSRQQTATFAVQGNQGNHYDGRWFAASSHSDWDQHIDHRWRNHDYRWYDGGWLIIDIGPGPGYDTGGSIGANVQASLAQQGYYGGPIDGYIGRGTRRAISHYESDNGLQVNGEIDEPLLVSLRLE